MNIWELVSFVAGVISLVVLLFVAWFFIVGLADGIASVMKDRKKQIGGDPEILTSGNRPLKQLNGGKNNE